MRRTTSSSPSSDPSDNRQPPSKRPELVAAEALVLYLKVLAFLQKGIAKAREFWAVRASTMPQQSASPDFNDGLFVCLCHPDGPR
jgi:serine/threonine-protein kinase ULK/ATG1